MSEQIRGIILEGQSCSGKSSIFKALKRLHYLENNSERNVLFLSEQYSQNLNDVNGELRQLSQTENLKVLTERVAMLEQLNGYVNSMGPHSRRSRGLFYVFERFHLNYAFCFRDRLDSQYKELEKRLKDLNAQTALCVISDRCIEPRLKHRASLTKTAVIEETISEYKKNQALYQSAAAHSAVPTMILHTDDMDWDKLAQLILEKLG